MIRAQANILISRPAEAVFEYVAVDFFKNYRRWSPEVISLWAISNGPVRLGATGQQVRMDMGFRTECKFRVSVFDLARRVDFAGISAPILSSYRMHEIGRQTRLTFIFEYSGPGFLILPFKKQLRSTVQEGARQMVLNIKQLMESEVAVSANITLKDELKSSISSA